MIKVSRQTMVALAVTTAIAVFALWVHTATGATGPCGLRLNPPHRQESRFQTPDGGKASRRALAGRFLLCTLKRRDGSLFARLNSDRDGHVLGVLFFRHNGALRNSVSATYLQAPAHVDCGASSNTALGPKVWTTQRKWWIGETPPGLNRESVIKAVRNAQSEWTNNINYCGIKDTANPPAKYMGTSPDNSITDNNNNVVGWGSLANDQDCAQALACTFTWYDGNGKPLESDIRFNSQFKWGLSGAPGTVDIQSVAAHEIGHVLQLDHVTGSNTVLMYPYFTSGDTSGRKLGRGDALADNSRY